VPKLQDCRVIGKVTVDDTNTLTFKVECPPGGWDETTRALLGLAKKDWTPLDFEVTGLDTPTDKAHQEERNKKLSKLAYLQDLYESSHGLNKGETTEQTYKKYGIKSRTELTDAQLDYEIESYKTALQNNAA
jgi:hypothetical protein